VTINSHDPDEQLEGLWVTSEAQPDGRYTIVVSVDGDRSWSLTGQEALDYARSVIEAATFCDYEQAVVASMRDTVSVDAIAYVIADLRAARGSVDYSATAPLRFVSGINSEGVGFIALWLDTKVVGQLTAAAARCHAVDVLAQTVVVDLDAAYRAVLVHRVGVTDERARVVVGALSNDYPQGKAEPT
jgi:hypothetical protein